MTQTRSDGNSRPLKIQSRAHDHASLSCSTCQGHLVADLYIDTVDAGGHVWIRALRCVRCRRIADIEREGLGALAKVGRIGKIPRELPEWGLNDEMTALGT